MYTYAALVDIGVSEHQNDDRVLISGQVLDSGSSFGTIEEAYFIAAVCDGVGGLAQGYRAAETTLNFMAHLNRSGVEAETLKKAIEESNRRVRALQVSENLCGAMCTTIAGIYAEDTRAFVFNAGDSRVYRFRYKYLLQLSKDHSLVQDLVDMGELQKEDVRSHVQKNIINKCIGHEEIVNPRVVEFSEDFNKGDIILICSDGITDCVEDSKLRDIMMQHKSAPDLEACCRAIMELAVASGSLDNMSIILIRKDD